MASRFDAVAERQRLVFLAETAMAEAALLARICDPAELAAALNQGAAAVPLLASAAERMAARARIAG